MLGDIISYANYDFISQQTHTPDGSASYRIITSNHDRESVSEMARMIDETLTDHNYSIQSVQSGTILRESATQSINVLIVFLLIMALLTAIVGSIGLTGTMSINVLERTREIGVMRTIGAVDSVIMRSVILEGLVIGIITWVLAIAVSFPISSFLLTIVGEAIMGSPMQLVLTPKGILLWLAVVLVLSVLASILPARNAARLTINEVLAYE
jgi:putative ABC transport system permease protein